MNLRTLLGGVAALLMIAGAAHAQDARGGFSFSLPGVYTPTAPQEERPVQLAQATDPRITQLEEQVRNLTGTLEELNFQILQMQDQLRRMQQDNELRFQMIEGGSGAKPKPEPEDDAAVSSPTIEDLASAPPPATTAPATTPPPPAATPSQPPATASNEGSDSIGQPPREFGSITFDKNGNVVGGDAAPQPAPADDTTVAALPQGGGADELYRNSYELILSGDYDTAEAGFRELIEKYPDGEHAADAHFWLGEALLAREKPREAAEIFLNASRDFPDARKAPDTLFKLGVSLAALGQRDVACATFAEVGKRYPETTDALKERIRQEQSLASC